MRACLNLGKAYASGLAIEGTEEHTSDATLEALRSTGALARSPAIDALIARMTAPVAETPAWRRLKTLQQAQVPII